MWKCVYFLLLFAALFTSSAGFRCHVCSYSSNTDKTRDCIDALDTLTAPGNFYVCNRTCIIREYYSLEAKKVTSYMRSCSSETKSGYCVSDTWGLFCYYSCIGELCNNYPGVLHTILPPQNADTAANTNDGSGGSGNSSPPVNGLSTLFKYAILVFNFVRVFLFL